MTRAGWRSSLVGALTRSDFGPRSLEVPIRPEIGSEGSRVGFRRVEIGCQRASEPATVGGIFSSALVQVPSLLYTEPIE